MKIGNELYVWNDGYLDISGDCVIFFGCVCFVFVIKGLIIQVDFLDFCLYEDGVGMCYQWLVIFEGGVEIFIDCDKKNEFVLMFIYMSQLDFFDI